VPKKSTSARRRQRRDAGALHQEARRAAKLEYTAEGRRRLVRKIVGGVLVAVGLLVVVTHMVVHLGNVHWLPTAGLRDLLTGYPMGAVFIVVGIVALSKQTTR
jgi:hypothetical protein